MRKHSRKQEKNIKKMVKEVEPENDYGQIPKATFIDKNNWEKLSYFFGTITVILSGGYIILNNTYIILYQKDCEDFYKIPGKYFVNNINNIASFGIVLILCVILFFSPLIVKRYMQKSDTYNKIAMYIYISFLTIILGVTFGIINTLNMVTVLKKIDTVIKIPQCVIKWINSHVILIMWTVVILAIVTILTFCLIQEIKEIKYKNLKKVILIVGVLSYLITTVLFFSAAFIKMTSSIKDKVQYETVAIDRKNMVILSTINDKFLVVEYSIKDGNTVFLTNNYMLIDNSNIMITYKEFETMPKIISKSP